MSRVARYHADRTNQKLYFARLQIKQAKSAENQQLQQGYQEAAVFHLYGAVQAFLQELSYYHGLTLLSPTIVDIRKVLADRTQVSPQLEVLAKLMDGGFIGELRRAYQCCQYAPKPTEKENETPESSQLIMKVTQSNQAWLPDVTLLGEWHKKLLQQIDSFRSDMLEC